MIKVEENTVQSKQLSTMFSLGQIKHCVFNAGFPTWLWPKFFIDFL